ncbi:MAG: hypothetical protein K2K24_03775, partial [Clostridia bacterium]|nr:hypothetical protein [Clostridia bacterium]
MAKWINGENNVPILSGLDDTTKGVVGYVYFDEDGNPLEDNATLESGKSYKVKAIFLGDNAKNYEFVTEDGLPTPNESAETDMEAFTVTASNSGGNLGGITGGDGQENPDEPTPSGDALGELLAKIKDLPLWQLIASVISILLTLIFVSKGIGYASKQKENKRQMQKYSTFYATAFLGISVTNWTIIACILIGVAVLAFIFMLLEKSGYKKSQRSLEDSKEEYDRNQKDVDNKRRDEQMQMMLMGMLGGNANGGGGAQQGFTYAQPMIGLGADDIRGIVADTMNNMLPNVQQYLPQEASYNDELVQQLIEQNAQNEERIRQLTEQNEERIRELTKHNEELMERLVDKISEERKESIDENAIEKLVEKLAKQQELEHEAQIQAEKEAAAANANEEIIKNLVEGQKAIMEKLSKQDEENAIIVEKTKKDEKDEKIEMLIKANENLVRNQEMLMNKVNELAMSNAMSNAVNSAVSNAMNRQQIVPIMQQPTERIIEKPVEKIVEKEVR